MGSKVAGFGPAGDDFFQFVSEAIDDFSYQNILSVEMANYDAFTDGCSGTMACFGENAKGFPQENHRKKYTLPGRLRNFFWGRAG
ncbi:MAG: hypothetical protein WCT30_03925 [Desulfurivibrionaceae bacterium]